MLTEQNTVMSAGYQGMDKDEVKKLESSNRHEDYEPLIYEQISEHDQMLTRTIQQKIRSHTEILNPNVSVRIQNGLVKLYGKIATYEERATIEALVTNISGVKEVINHLEFDYEGAIEKNLTGHANLSLPRKDI